MERRELTIKEKIENIEKLLEGYKHQRRKNLTSYRRARTQSNWIKCHDLRIISNRLNSIVFELELALGKPISEIEKKKEIISLSAVCIEPEPG